MEIEQIYAKDYKGYTKEVHYWTNAYYDIQNSDHGFGLQWCAFEHEIEKSFIGTLFSDDLEDPVVFGAFHNGEMIGFIEGSVESWHNLFRITFFYIEPQHRHFGIGEKLMKHMIEYATIHTTARAIVVDTESCNIQAINFYKHHGFHMVGLNTMDYSNEDIEEKEVHLIFGRKIERPSYHAHAANPQTMIRKP